MTVGAVTDMWDEVRGEWATRRWLLNEMQVNEREDLLGCTFQRQQMMYWVHWTVFVVSYASQVMLGK